MNINCNSIALMRDMRLLSRADTVCVWCAVCFVEIAVCQKEHHAGVISVAKHECRGRPECTDREEIGRNQAGSLSRSAIIYSSGRVRTGVSGRRDHHRDAGGYVAGQQWDLALLLKVIAVINMLSISAWTDDSGWWYGHTEAEEFVNGFFPSEYVVKLSDESSSEKDTNGDGLTAVSGNGEVASEDGRRAVLLYDYVAEKDGELTVNEGDEVIVITEHAGSGWSYVRTVADGKDGYIPREFFKLASDQQTAKEGEGDSS